MVQTVKTMVLRILIGSVLTSAMTICLAYLSLDLYLYLETFENSKSLKLLSFSALFILIAAGLFYLFLNQKIPLKNELQIMDEQPLRLDLKPLGMKFVEGVLDGLLEKK
jgi:hypothetical protein